MSEQESWVSALRSPTTPVPAGLTAWNGSDPDVRFGVYRNNVMISLIEALADTFMVVQRLVGDAFFHAMAREFVKAHPPTSPVLAFYGRNFPAFIDTFAPAQNIPYLADVALLEMAYVEAFHAPDTETIQPQAILDLMADPDHLAHARLVLSPSLTVLQSPFPIVRLWSEHQGEEGMPGIIDIEDSENAWVLRNGLSVSVLSMRKGDCIFANLIRHGAPLLDATNEALAADPAFEPTHCLSTLIRENAISGFIA